MGHACGPDCNYRNPLVMERSRVRVPSVAIWGACSNHHSNGFRKRHPDKKENTVTNAEKFHAMFGMYATEVWSLPEPDFLKWLNGTAGKESIPNLLEDGTLIVSVQDVAKIGRVFVVEEGTRFSGMFYPDGQETDCIGEGVG